MLRIISRSRFSLPLLYCLGISVFFLYEFILRCLPSVVSAGATEAYHLSTVSYGLLCALFYLAYVPLQLGVGFFVDRYQAVYSLSVSLLVCAIGCLLFANGHNYLLAQVGRILMGAGSSLIFVSLLKAISLRFMASRFIFYLGLVICLAMVGSMLLHAFLIAVLVSWGWRIVCYFLTFIALGLVIYSLIEFKFLKPVVTEVCQPLSEEFKVLAKIFTNKDFWIRCAIATLLYLPLVGFAQSWGVTYLKYMSQFSHISASLDSSMVYLGFALGAPLVGWIYYRTAQCQLILTAGSVGVTIMLSIVLYVPAMSSVNAGFSLFLLGMFSSTSIVIFNLNRQLVEKENVGKVFAMTNLIMMLGGFSAWGVGILIDSIKHSTISVLLSLYSISDYQLAFVILPVASLLAVFLSFFVRDPANSI